MKKSHIFILLLLCSSLLIGAKGCTVWVETDKDEYSTGEEGLATLHNDSPQTIYLSGCADFVYEKLRDDGTWADMGPDKVCVWEGYARPMEPHGGALSTMLQFNETGTWRLHYNIGYECKEKMPLNEENCASITDIFSNEIEVIESHQNP
jgi:hypothetical protein